MTVKEKNRNMKIHCLFEQSGTFKNEFKKLGYEAYDYDILNDFAETDHQIDLYNEINKAYEQRESIFDSFSSNDLLMAFFPCIRFEVQILLWFRGDAMQQKKWSLEKKLEYDLNLHEELARNYMLITKLALICIKRNIPLIIENPYSTQHYLINYWGIKPTMIHWDRTKKGDSFKKPTAYWFINCKPKNNINLDKIRRSKNYNTIAGDWNTVNRSMISKEYAYNFIKSYIL